MKLRCERKGTIAADRLHRFLASGQDRWLKNGATSGCLVLQKKQPHSEAAF